MISNCHTNPAKLGVKNLFLRVANIKGQDLSDADPL